MYIIMTPSVIRQKLHQFIDQIEDKKAAAIYALLEEDVDSIAQRKKLILAERENYLKGNGKSNSWDEVKAMAANKTKRHVL